MPENPAREVRRVALVIDDDEPREVDVPAAAVDERGRVVIRIQTGAPAWRTAARSAADAAHVASVEADNAVREVRRALGDALAKIAELERRAASPGVDEIASALAAALATMPAPVVHVEPTLRAVLEQEPREVTFARDHDGKLIGAVVE